MVCKKCGQSFEDGFNNCPNCGTSVNDKVKTKKPIYKKWWFWLIIIILAIGVFGSSGGDNSTETTTGTEQVIVHTPDDVTVNEGVEETTTADDGFIHVGETVSDSNLEITYVSAEKWTDYDQFTPPAKGNIIVKLCFEAKNTGSSDRYLSFYDFECYADGSAAEMYIWGDDNLSFTLSAGRKGSGYVYFEVPETAESIEVEYETNIWGNEKAIFLVKLS